MRTIPMPELGSEEEHDKFYDNVNISDWRENTKSVLKDVDEELKKHGLEVIMYNFVGDSYLWTISQRKQ